MNTNPDPAAQPGGTDPAASPAVASRARRRRLVAAPFNTSTLLATTAVLAATQPKLPPFQGD